MKGKTSDQMVYLNKYFTNPGGRVTSLTPEAKSVDVAAALSMYSRNQKVIEDIFVEDIEPGKVKSSDFFSRVFGNYGDDSVAELTGAYLSFSGVSQVLSKVIEDPRIAFSAIEKSTRYVTFAKKDDEGKYQYVREPTIMKTPFAGLYERLCDYQFDSHVKSFDIVHEWVKEKNPIIESETELAFAQSRRAKALDITRGLLPAATKTNIGVFANGRTMENLLVKLFSAPYAESRQVGEESYAELMKVIPDFVSRVKVAKYGQAQIDYLTERDKRMQGLTKEMLGGLKPMEVPEVTLVEFASMEDQIMSRALYENSDLPLSQINSVVASMGDQERRIVMRAYLGERKDRRHKPGRALEAYPLTFDVLSSYAILRDLQRQRMQSQFKQKLTTKFGYDMPEEIAENGLEKKWKDVMSISDDVFRELEEDFPYESQYVVPMASNVRWYMSMNPREMFWVGELRTTPQGHPSYRRVVNDMWDKAAKKHPLIFESPIMEKNRKDCKGLVLERQASEIKISKKMEK